jgi:hypothetical protein
MDGPYNMNALTKLCAESTKGTDHMRYRGVVGGITIYFGGRGVHDVSSISDYRL